MSARRKHESRQKMIKRAEQIKHQQAFNQLAIQHKINESLSTKQASVDDLDEFMRHLAA